MIYRIEAALNRLVAFSSASSAENEAVDLYNISLTLERASEIVLLTEACMSLCVALLESSPTDSDITRAVLMLLSRCCMRCENREITVRFGVSGLCMIVLRDHKDLSEETLFATLDLAGTLAMDNGNTRQMMRPYIPYIAQIMKDRSDSLQLAFGSAVVIGSLVMLDTANAKLAAENDFIQLLVSAFIRAIEKRKRLLQRCRTPQVARIRQGEDADLCDTVMHWTRDALQKLILAPIPIIDVKLEATNFGCYGMNVEVDEFKWKLTFERRKITANWS
ncbi:hypothetical protein ERJ75_000319500 [Trypanosoma vivax]|uniref:Uncharacterized protein n=1 Tax=Trypanosoma vivax (strain Y486) TaxID=1055687 RepID=G0UA77_TRYVY|nr:hypothetical protein TRVL_06997 [Trypanosoma vivax]KAH8618002.1 hypothetical protein ERJ75_000319500 [Trypanosoma vivax]CCC52709.1 conserved hypothetical protein [Trypanosoma vivax Y486]